MHSAQLPRGWYAGGGFDDGIVAAVILSSAFGNLASIIDDPSIGPDSYAGYLVSMLQRSTKTTFYMLVI